MTQSKNLITTIVYIYNSYNDPLFQNLVLRYIKLLANNPYYEFHIITFGVIRKRSIYTTFLIRTLKS